MKFGFRPRAILAGLVIVAGSLTALQTTTAHASTLPPLSSLCAGFKYDSSQPVGSKSKPLAYVDVYWNQTSKKNCVILRKVQLTDRKTFLALGLAADPVPTNHEYFLGGETSYIHLNPIYAPNCLFVSAQVATTNVENDKTDAQFRNGNGPGNWNTSIWGCQHK